MLMNLCYEDRLNAQLEGISHCLKSSLTHVVDTHHEYLDLGSIPQSSGIFSDHLLSADQCLGLSVDNGTWLKLAPLAPGGLFCDKLLLQADCDSYATLQQVIGENRIEAKPACVMTSAEFHSRFRSDAQGHALQSDRANYRILIMMPDGTESRHEDSLVEKICSLLDTLKPVPSQTSIECVHRDAFGANHSRELMARLRARIPGMSRMGMTAVTPDRKSMLGAMMGNASIALCGNLGNLADAFQFDLPVALWKDEKLLDVDAINHHSIKWLRHGCHTSKSMVARQQQKSWLRGYTGDGSAIVVDNACRQLRSTIEKWLKHDNSGTSLNITLQGHWAGRALTERPVSCLDFIIPSAFSPAASPSRLQLLRTSLERKHRKFVKFRQSPSRFIEDSEVRWLRAFKHPR